MALLLFKFIFFVVGTLSDLITRMLLGTAAHVVVQMFQLIKGPGDQSQRLLEQVRDMISACLEYVLGIVISVIGTILSALVDAIKDGVVNSSTGVVTAMIELAEKSKTSMEEAMQEVPEVLNAFGEMVGKIIADVLSNCNEAFTYVTRNVFK